MPAENNEVINDIAFHQGISDFVRGHNRVPKYWKDSVEGEVWKKGYNFARRWGR